MWNRFVAWAKWRAGYGRCFSCGTMGFHSWKKTRSKFQRFYTTQSGERLIRFVAFLQVDGLCGKCFDVRSEKWCGQTDGVFSDVFDPEVKSV